MSLLRFSGNYPSLLNRFLENVLFDLSNRNYSNTNPTLPSVNIKESAEGFEVEVAATGFSKSDFNIELNHDLLTLPSDLSYRQALFYIILLFKIPQFFQRTSRGYFLCYPFH